MVDGNDHLGEKLGEEEKIRKGGKGKNDKKQR